MTGLVVVVLAALVVLGVPLFAVFGAASMMLFAGLPDTPITGAANDVFGDKFASSPLLVTIPLFTFAGYLLAESGTPKRLVALSRAWLGWMPGGLAIVCLVASAFFTTFTGGSGITIIAIGGLLFPALLDDDYPERFSLGLVTAGGSLGLLFPPSLPLILYGVVASGVGVGAIVLIEKLFLAGVVPGLLTLLALSGYAVLVGRRGRAGSRRPFVAREAWRTLWTAKWEAMLPVLLLVALYGGFLRVHEAAAVTALYVLVIETFIYKDVSIGGDLPRIFREAATLVGAILAILATAIGFTAFLIQARVPQLALEAMEAWVDSPFWFLLALNVFLILVGMLMDIFSAIVVVVPLIVPIADHFGIDPYHLGIVFLLNLEIGYLTPPVGLNLFISSFRFERPLPTLYRASLPFIGILLVALGITTYVPGLSTWLPEQVRIGGEGPTGGDGAGREESPAPTPGDREQGPATLDDLESGFEEDDEAPATLDDLESGFEDDDEAPATLDDLESGFEDDEPDPAPRSR